MQLYAMLAFPPTVHPSHLELRERHDREEDVEGGEEEDDGAERHGCKPRVAEHGPAGLSAAGGGSGSGGGARGVKPRLPALSMHQRPACLCWGGGARSRMEAGLERQSEEQQVRAC